MYLLLPRRDICKPHPLSFAAKTKRTNLSAKNNDEIKMRVVKNTKMEDGRNNSFVRTLFILLNSRDKLCRI